MFFTYSTFSILKKLCAFNINLACSGFCYSISIADSLQKNSVRNSALIITTESDNKDLDQFDKGIKTVFGGFLCK